VGGLRQPGQEFQPGEDLQVKRGHLAQHQLHSTTRESYSLPPGLVISRPSYQLYLSLILLFALLWKLYYVNIFLNFRHLCSFYIHIIYYILPLAFT
jgi:hypothetical protein